MTVTVLPPAVSVDVDSPEIDVEADTQVIEHRRVYSDPNHDGNVIITEVANG